MSTHHHCKRYKKQQQKISYYESGKSLISEVDDLCNFIHSALNKLDESERKRKHIEKWNEKKRQNQLINDERNINEVRKQYKIKNLSDWKSHVKILKNRDKLHLFWYQYFEINDSEEKELSEWIKCSNDLENTISTLTNQEFHEYLLRLKSNNNHGYIFKNESLNHKFDDNPSLIIKTMQMFWRRRYQMNDQTNFKTLIDSESKWWNTQINLNSINYTEWMEKSNQYSISPFVLVKHFLKSKRLFLGYAASNELQKRERKFKQGLINSPNRRKRNIAKIQLKFFTEICQIPAMNTNWKQDELLREKQYHLYNKWVNFAIYVHQIKWLEHQNVKYKNPESFQILSEFEQTEEYKKDKSDYSIPNIDCVLNEEMIDVIARLCISDGSIRDNIRIYKDFTVRESSALFEKVVNTKINEIVSIYNNMNDFGDEYRDNIKLQVKNEKKLRKLHRSKMGKNEESLLSPDLLFSSPININGYDIVWMDMKFYFVTPNDKIGFSVVTKSILKYVKRFGNGAIISCGLNQNCNDAMKKLLTENECGENHVIVVDASEWIAPFIKVNINE